MSFKTFLEKTFELQDILVDMDSFSDLTIDHCRLMDDIFGRDIAKSLFIFTRILIYRDKTISKEEAFVLFKGWVMSGKEVKIIGVDGMITPHDNIYNHEVFLKISEKDSIVVVYEDNHGSVNMFFDVVIYI